MVASLVRYSHTVVVAIAAAAMVGGAAARPLLHTGPKPQGPQTIDEAVAIAQRLGLCCGTDEPDGVPCNLLVVSDSGLTREDITSLWIGDFGRPRWFGKVRIYKCWQSLAVNYDPACCAVWGKLFIYGDPEIIQQLTAKLR